MPHPSEPGREPDPGLATRLHSAAVHLLRRVREADRTLPVGPARASALSVLVFGGPRTHGALASAEQVSAATMSRMVAGLVRAGLVRRERDPADARRVWLSATPRAERILRAGRDAREAHLQRLLANLTPPERAALAAAVSPLERLATAPPAVGGARAPSGGPRHRRR